MCPTRYPADQTGRSNRYGCARGPLAKLLRLPVHFLHVTFGRNHLFADPVDVILVLDQVFGDPRGVFVGLQHHRQVALGRDEMLANCLELWLRDFLGPHLPLVRPDLPAFEETRFPLQRVVIFAAGRIGAMRTNPLDRIQTEGFKKLLEYCPSMYLLRKQGIR